jgi:hypothetical protein
MLPTCTWHRCRCYAQYSAVADFCRSHWHHPVWSAETAAKALSHCWRSCFHRLFKATSCVVCAQRDGLAALLMDLEMPLVAVLADMEQAGMACDPGCLKRQLPLLSRRMRELKVRSGGLCMESAQSRALSYLCMRCDSVALHCSMRLIRSAWRATQAGQSASCRCCPRGHARAQSMRPSAKHKRGCDAQGHSCVSSACTCFAELHMVAEQGSLAAQPTSMTRLVGEVLMPLCLPLKAAAAG